MLFLPPLFSVVSSGRRYAAESHIDFFSQRCFAYDAKMLRVAMR